MFVATTLEVLIEKPNLYFRNRFRISNLENKSRYRYRNPSISSFRKVWATFQRVIKGSLRENCFDSSIIPKCELAVKAGYNSELITVRVQDLLNQES